MTLNGTAATNKSTAPGCSSWSRPNHESHANNSTQKKIYKSENLLLVVGAVAKLDLPVAKEGGRRLSGQTQSKPVKPGQTSQPQSNRIKPNQTESSLRGLGSGRNWTCQWRKRPVVYSPVKPSQTGSNRSNQVVLEIMINHVLRGKDHDYD